MMTGFDVLKSAAEVSDQVEKAREFIRGGPLTDVLEAIGDLHLRSAIDHLRQAARSEMPRDRMLQAAAEMQTAFLAYEKAASAGPLRWVRIRMDGPAVATAHGRATGCAAAVSLIQWVLGESASNRRQWLDRTARHVAEHCRNERDLAVRGYSGLAKDWTGSQWGFKSSDSSWMVKSGELNNLIEAYLNLERNTLPPDLVRPRPLSFLPAAATPSGLELWRHPELLYSDENWLPKFEPG